MPVNVKLLKKVRKLIAEEPRRLAMGVWGQRYSEVDIAAIKSLPPCGTTACLAGHIVLAATPRHKLDKMFDGNGELKLGYQLTSKGEERIIARATRLIGLKRDDCPFYEQEWGALEVLAWIDRQIDAAQSK